MSPAPASRLEILPGTTLVVILVHLGRAVTTLLAPPGRFLELLKAATAATTFDELQREEPALDELLPWTGNV